MRGRESYIHIWVKGVAKTYMLSLPAFRGLEDRYIFIFIKYYLSIYLSTMVHVSVLKALRTARGQRGQGDKNIMSIVIIGVLKNCLSMER